MRDNDEQLLGAVLTFIALVVIAVIAVIAVVDCRKREACEARGGVVERYNFRTVYIPQSCGENCTIVVPHEVSDWRCVGGRAEAE